MIIETIIRLKLKFCWIISSRKHDHVIKNYTDLKRLTIFLQWKALHTERIFVGLHGWPSAYIEIVCRSTVNRAEVNGKPWRYFDTMRTSKAVIKVFFVQLINLTNLGKQAGLSRCSVQRIFSAIFTSNYWSIYPHPTPTPTRKKISSPTSCLASQYQSFAYICPHPEKNISPFGRYISRRLWFLVLLRATGKSYRKPCPPELFCSLFCHCTTAEDTSSLFDIRLLTTYSQGARMGKHLGPWWCPCGHHIGGSLLVAASWKLGHGAHVGPTWGNLPIENVPKAPWSNLHGVHSHVKLIMHTCISKWAHMGPCEPMWASVGMLSGKMPPFQCEP